MRRHSFLRASRAAPMAFAALPSTAQTPSVAVGGSGKTYVLARR